MEGELEKRLEQGVFLGTLQENDYPEVYCAIYSSKLKRNVFLFSPELTFLNLDASAGSSKNNLLKRFFPKSIAPCLRTGEKVNFLLSLSSPEVIQEKKKPQRAISFLRRNDFFKKEVRYLPKELQKRRITPYRDVLLAGRIVSEDKRFFFVKAGLNLAIEKNPHTQLKGFKVGDWVRGNIYDISFFRIN